MPAASIAGYCGPRSRRPPGAALELPAASWGYMPKVDGCAARVRLDERGRVASVLSRAGLEMHEGSELLGIVAGFPDSILWGELECATEASVRAVASRGWPLLHLWDVERSDGRDLSAMPFATRHSELYRAQSYVEGERQARDRSRRLDARGVAHDRAGRFAPHVGPRDLRRLPVVPLARGLGAGVALWRSYVELAGGEGVVAARLDAPIRGREAKIKVRAEQMIDAVIVELDRRLALLVYAGRAFIASRPARMELRIGTAVEVRIDGFTEATSTPKHPRIVRSRPDLSHLECGHAPTT